METNKNTIDDLPEMILADILVKLSIKNIAIAKVVCKRWKSLVESVILRILFVSLHQNNLCSWSLLKKNHYPDNNSTEELIGLYGCERWRPPRSLGSYISPPFLDSRIEIESFVIKATSTGLLLNLSQDDKLYVGNPVSREWVKILPCTLCIKRYLRSQKFGLATRVDETGEWTCENVRCPCPIPWSSSHYPEPISLNGMLHWVEHGDQYDYDAGGLVAIDLYNANAIGENQCWVIPFPNENFLFTRENNYIIWPRRACTTSGGFIMYINMVSESKMKVWSLKKDYYAIESGEYWQLSCQMDLAHVDYGVGSIPVVLHPFDTNIFLSMERGEEFFGID